MVDTVVQTYYFGKFLYHSPFVNAKLHAGVDLALTFPKNFVTLTGQFFDGLKSHPVKLTYCTIKNSDSLYTLVVDSFKLNIFYYAGPVIVYEGWIRPASYWMAPELKNSSTENIYNYPIQFLFFFFAIGTFLKNIYYVLRMTDQTKKLTSADNFPVCRHEKQTKTSADIESLVALPLNLFTAKLFFWTSIFLSRNLLPDYAGYLGYISYSGFLLALGQSVIDVKLSQRGVCTEDRSKYFAAHHGEHLAYGLTFLLASEGLKWILKASALFADSGYFADAASGFVTQLYIILALSLSEPFVGNKAGIDFFKWNRDWVSQQQKELVTWLTPLLSNAESRREMIKSSLAVVNYPPLKLFASLIIGLGLFPYRIFYETPAYKWMRVESFLQVPEIRNLVEMHGKQIKQIVEGYHYVRSAAWLSRGAKTIDEMMPAGLKIPVISTIIHALNEIANVSRAFADRLIDMLVLVVRVTEPSLRDKASIKKPSNVDANFFPPVPPPPLDWDLIEEEWNLFKSLEWFLVNSEDVPPVLEKEQEIPAVQKQEPEIVEEEKAEITPSITWDKKEQYGCVKRVLIKFGLFACDPDEKEYALISIPEPTHKNSHRKSN